MSLLTVVAGSQFGGFVTLHVLNRLAFVNFDRQEGRKACRERMDA